ncbi:hypothetical protein, partial [Baaleninema sp.]|uniref:hypothetical protein n=1 Tax=Baaleninema sp. TaxID=3101197 RepID=UPI003CFEAFA6
MDSHFKVLNISTTTTVGHFDLKPVGFIDLRVLGEPSENSGILVDVLPRLKAGGFIVLRVSV